ncbi:MAG: tetratricopeptide repeat protein [Patescibacteria group bacterium]
MNIRTKPLLLGLGALIIVGIIWSLTGPNGFQDDGITKGKTWFGQVNEENIDLSEEVLAQWNIQLQTAIASYKAKEDMGVLNNIGSLYLSLGQFAKAREVMEIYLTKNTINDAAYVLYGDILVRMEDWKGANTAYLKAVELSGINEQLAYKMETLWREHMPERISNIKGLYEAAIAYDGQKKFYMVQLGRWYAEQGDFANAASHLKVAVTLNPDNKDLKKEMEEYEQKAREQELNQ